MMNKTELQQAIREVLLSEEFLAAFAKAWLMTPVPETQFRFDEGVDDGAINLSEIMIDEATPFGAFSTVQIDTESPGLIPGADAEYTETGRR